MGEKTTTQCDYYMEYGDFAAGKVALNRHPIGVAVNPLFGTLVNDPSMPGRMVALGSNYLFLDLHVDNLLSAPSAGALDPWDFTNGQTPPGYTPPPAQ